MSASQIAFLILGSLVLLMALLVVSVRNIVHAALSLVACFAGVAGIYVLLQAEFLAVAQVLIYIGAITVLILFGIMLTRQITGRDTPPLASHWRGSLVAAALFFILLLYVVRNGPWPVTEGAAMDSTVGVGQLLALQYVLPFELVSLILLAALVGAVLIAKEEKR